MNMHAEREIIQEAKTHIHTRMSNAVCVQQLAQRGAGLKEQRGRQRLRAAAWEMCEHKHACRRARARTHTRAPVCWTVSLLSHQGRNKSNTE